MFNSSNIDKVIDLNLLIINQKKSAPKSAFLLYNVVY